MKSKANNYLKLTIRSCYLSSNNTGTVDETKTHVHEIVPVNTRKDDWQTSAALHLRRLIETANSHEKGTGRHVVRVNLSAHDPAPFRRLLPRGCELEISRIGTIV